MWNFFWWHTGGIVGEITVTSIINNISGFSIWSITSNQKFDSMVLVWQLTTNIPCPLFNDSGGQKIAINDEFFEQDKKTAKNILRAVQPVTILRGETLYRFASTTWHPHFWFASPWWVSKQTYQHIQKQLKLSVIPNWIARTTLGVKVGWSNRMDLIVRARVRSELRA